MGEITICNLPRPGDHTQIYDTTWEAAAVGPLDLIAELTIFFWVFFSSVILSAGDLNMGFEA